MIFGGYTEVGFQGKENYSYDNNAFLFSISKGKIYNIRKDISNNYAILDRMNLGPCFDGNCCYTSSIGSNMLEAQSSTSSIQGSFYLGMSIDYELNNGEQYFYVQEIEIYQITAN